MKYEDLALPEQKAFNIAKAQVEGGKFPSDHVALICVYTLARLLGRPIDETVRSM